jgi:hypothetical protein
MAIMSYNLFKQIFNEAIFEKSKADLLEKMASSPSRYIGLFRPTKPKAKILQNLLQSHEIRFGDAFERIIEEYFRLKGCEILPKRFTNLYFFIAYSQTKTAHNTGNRYTTSSKL